MAVPGQPHRRLPPREPERTEDPHGERRRPTPARAGAGTSSSRSSSPSPGGTASAGSACRRRRADRAAARAPSRQLPAARAMAPAVAHDGRAAHARTRPAPRARSSSVCGAGRERGVEQERGEPQQVERRGAAPPRPARPAPSSATSGERRRAQSQRRDGTSDHRGRLDLLDDAPERRVGGDALELELRRHRDPVPEHRRRELLHVVGHDVRPAVEQRRRLRHLEQRHAAPRRRAQREHRRAARGPHDGRDVGDQASAPPAPGAPRRAGGPGPRASVTRPMP